MLTMKRWLPAVLPEALPVTASRFQTNFPRLKYLTFPGHAIQGYHSTFSFDGYCQQEPDNAQQSPESRMLLYPLHSDA